MMGVYGMLAIGLALFCLRYLIPAERWPEKWARIAFWATNIGLAWMCFATLLPLGIAQLYKSVDERLLRGPRAGVPDHRHQPAARVAAAARATSCSSSAAPCPCSTSPTSGIRHTVKRVTLDEPEDILFTEITEPAGVAARRADEATAAKLS